MREQVLSLTLWAVCERVCKRGRGVGECEGEGGEGWEDGERKLERGRVIR